MPVCVVCRVCVVVVCNSCTFSRHLLFASQFFFQQFTAFSLLHLSTVSYIVYYLWMWEASLAYKLRCWSEGTQHTQMITHIHTCTDTCIHTPSLALRPCKYPFGFEGEATFCCLSVWCTESCLRAAPFLLFIYFIFALFLPFWHSFADNSLPHEFFFFSKSVIWPKFP